ncbi:MAG TPA: sigma-70 family RNA polymerase sigma factor, partial [Vicinamibacterales bacterium]
DNASLPAVLVPSEPPSPDRVYEETEIRDRMRAAIGQLPARERRIVSMYYFHDATMKQIGDAIGVNESRVSQLHARAIERLRRILAGASLPARQTPRPRLAPRSPRQRRAAPIRPVRIHDDRAVA